MMARAVEVVRSRAMTPPQGRGVMDWTSQIAGTTEARTDCGTYITVQRRWDVELTFTPCGHPLLWVPLGFYLTLAEAQAAAECREGVTA